MVPSWLHVIAILSLAIGFLCAAIIVVDEFKDPQHMWIMNVVWPATALFGSVLTLWGYYRYGMLATMRRVHEAKQRDEEMPSRKLTPFPAMVGKGAHALRQRLHARRHLRGMAGVRHPRGRGLVRLADDLRREDLRRLDPRLRAGLPVRRGLPILHDQADAHLAGQGLVQAAKADALSLTAWQLGMYGVMALAHFWIFAQLLGTRLQVASFEFWFMMQIAMMPGFLTAYPVNWWLISKGIKERM